MLGACRCAGCVPWAEAPPGVCAGGDVNGVDCAEGTGLDGGGAVVPLCCAHATIKKGKRSCGRRTSTTQIRARPRKTSRAKVAILLFGGSDSEALFPTSRSISKPLADPLKPNHSHAAKKGRPPRRPSSKASSLPTNHFAGLARSCLAQLD